LAGARLAIAQQQTVKLEESHAFNGHLITLLNGQLQPGVLPQLERYALATLQGIALPDARKQAKLISSCAHELLDSVCAPHVQEFMHVVSGQRQQLLVGTVSACAAAMMGWMCVSNVLEFDVTSKAVF
jgi:hypothetical protein